MNVRYPLQINDVLIVLFPEEKPSTGLTPERIPLDIVYEDDYVLVINKPPGMSTIPSREHPTGSLANRLIGYFQRVKLQATTHIVTRLDRDTSGLVLVAKHRHVHHLLSQQQKSGLIKRTYVAFAEGVFKTNSGRIEEPIGRSDTSIIEREVRSDGQYALTHYRVMQQFASFTFLELQLATGRTHQIRVHLSYIGHPLLGDDLYGGRTDLMNRQALHCKQLLFKHPFLNETLQLSSELPVDMVRLL